MVDAYAKTALFINGLERDSSNGQVTELRNPAKLDEAVGEFARGTVDDVDAAMEAAAQAYPSWSGYRAVERAEKLREIADFLVADPEDVTARTRLLTREHGKPLFESNIEITRIADRFRQVANFAERLDAEQNTQSPMFDTVVQRKGRGVTTLIVPWNWPLAILGAKFPQALLAGNTVVIKLAENATLATAQTIIKIAKLLPPGVVNLITGPGRELGDRLVGHPLVRQVNFTGSVGVGQRVMKICAENITDVTLELGGNDAGLMLEDVDTSGNFYQRLFHATFLTSGQICMAMKRLYVHRSRYEEILEGFSAFLNGITIGNGLTEGVQMGPINNERQFKVVQEFTREAEAAGVELRRCGQWETSINPGQGYFLPATLAVNPDPRLQVVRLEQFGPILPIIPFDTDEEALTHANDCELGLSSSVWSTDVERAVALARRIDAGYTNINAHGPTAMDGLSPFGGVKQSGIGRNFGFEGIQQFQEAHSISMPKGALG